MSVRLYRTCCEMIDYHRTHQAWHDDLEVYDIVLQAFIHNHPACLEYIQKYPFDYNDPRYTYYAITEGNTKIFSYLITKGSPWVSDHSLLAAECEEYDILQTAWDLNLPFHHCTLEYILKRQEYNIFTSFVDQGVEPNFTCFKILDKGYKAIDLVWNWKMRNVLSTYIDEVSYFPNLMKIIEDYERKKRSLIELVHYILDPILPVDVITYEILSFW